MAYVARQVTLSAATVPTIGTAVPVNSFRFVNVAIAWGTGCSGGQIAVKIADHANQTADWATLATVNFDAAKMAAAIAAGKTSYQDTVEITAPHGATRADAVTITGGAVTATVQAWNGV